MHIDEWWFGDAVILDLKGQMTMSDSDQLLKNKVKSLVNQGQKNIVLNLAAVPYIDSAGLGEIVRVHMTVSREGGSLTLQNPTKRFTELLSITKLTGIFNIDGQGADD